MAVQPVSPCTNCLGYGYLIEKNKKILCLECQGSGTQWLFFALKLSSNLLK